MVYFSFNDFVDCEQSEEIYKVRKLGENVVKYEQISKTGKNENSIIEIIKNKNELKFDVENLYRQYSTETSATTEVVDQTTMDSKLNELYEEKIEKNIIQKTEELGYEIDSCNVKAHISDQDTGIEQIFIRCNLDENGIETVKKFIIQEYGVNEKCLRIS